MPEILTPEIIKSADGILAKYAGSALTRTGERTFEGHGVRWHDPNGRVRYDLTGEWFSRKTFLMRSAGYPIVGIPANYQHGMVKDFGSLGIGIVNFTDEDEIGQFIRGQLKERADYIAMLQEIGRKGDVKFTDAQLGRKADLAVKSVDTLVAELPLQFSGGFDPSTWIVDEQTKHIDQAGMIHIAFTPTPADDLNPMVRFKSAWQEVVKYESSTSYSIPQIQTDIRHEGGNTGDGQSVRKDAGSADVEQDTTPIPAKETNTMDEQMIRELIRMVLEEYKQSMQGEQAAPALPAEEEVLASVRADAPAEPPKDEEDMAKSVAKIMEAARANIRAFQAKRQKTLDVAREYQKRTMEVPDNLPAGSSNGNGHKAYDIQVMSRYQKWDARDYSFALNIAQLQGGNPRRLLKSGRFDQAFFREYADKASKAYQAGTLTLSENAIKSVRAIKSDELDYSTQAGFGDEAVPNVWSEDIWERPRLDNVIQNVFESVEMPSNPYEYPVESTDPTVYYIVETKNDAQLSLDSTTRPIPSSKVGTNKITFTAKKFGLQVEWSSELEEDSIARLIPQFRKQAERAMQDKGIDSIALNGDTSTTTNINSDGETITAANRHYLAYDGLIHQPLVSATTNRLDAGGVAPTLSMMRSLRRLLGNAEAYNPANLALIVDFPTYSKLLGLDEVVTVDKYGDQATVLRGELAKLDGIAIFVSNEMALADSDGKVTQTANVVDRGRALLVHRPSWKMGYRRQVTQSLDFISGFDMWLLTITMRNHFLPRTATNGALQSTDDTTAILFNIAV